MLRGENRLNRDPLNAVSAALDPLETRGAGWRSWPLALYTNGIDLGWLATVSGGGRILVRHVPAARPDAGFPAVTIAAINGHALTAGAILATAHHSAVMREDCGN